MKYLISVFITLLTALHAVAGQADLQLQRATLTVGDMDRSIAFYTDLLGFTVSGDARYDTPALRTMFHIPDGVTPRLVLLDASPEQPRALALVHAEGLAVDADSNARHAPALVINTTQLDEILERAVAAGATVVLPATPLNDFAGNPFGREAMVLDPDGVRIVFFELLESDTGSGEDHD